MRTPFVTIIKGHLVAVLCAGLLACGGGGGSGDSSAATPTTPSSTPTTPTTTPTTPTTPTAPNPVIAAECVPSASFQYARQGSIAKVAAAETVFEMTGADAAASAGAVTIQAMGTSPGDLTFQLYTLSSQGQCSAALAAQSSDTGHTMQAQGTIAGGSRVFVVLNSSATLMVQMCAYAGSTTEPCDSGTALVSGVALDSSQSPVAGATVAIVNNGTTYSTKTDATGLFSLQSPASTLPDHFVANVYDGVHAPATLTFNQVAASNVYGAGTVNLASVTAARIPLELTPTVHHLGDGNFGGSANSQFQFPTAEGLSVDYPFQLTSASLAYASATFSITAKGIECPDTLAVNGTVLSTFDPTPSDGSYALASGNVPMGLLRLGANVVTIASHPCSGSDYDDFEITAPMLAFQ
jgi:hypothetical protein